MWRSDTKIVAETSNLLGLIGLNSMDPSYVPIYYQPNSILEVQIANSTVVRHYRVVRPLTPFTMAQVIVVRDTNDPKKSGNRSQSLRPPLHDYSTTRDEETLGCSV